MITLNEIRQKFINYHYNNKELNRCPICNGRPQARKWNSSVAVFISCTKCNHQSKEFHSLDYKSAYEKAKKHWNKGA